MEKQKVWEGKKRERMEGVGYNEGIREGREE